MGRRFITKAEVAIERIGPCDPAARNQMELSREPAWEKAQVESSRTSLRMLRVRISNEASLLGGAPTAPTGAN